MSAKRPKVEPDDRPCLVKACTLAGCPYDTIAGCVRWESSTYCPIRLEDPQGSNSGDIRKGVVLTRITEDKHGEFPVVYSRHWLYCDPTAIDKEKLKADVQRFCKGEK
jgi:hypothetical protein